MGKTRMKCPNCGTTNINDMLVTYHVKTPKGDYLDTTTLPKFLYYLEHPQDVRGKTGSQRRPSNIVLPIKVQCQKADCIRSQHSKKGDAGCYIPTTRFGV